MKALWRSALAITLLILAAPVAASTPLERGVKLLEKAEQELDAKSLMAAENIVSKECAQPSSDPNCDNYLTRIYLAKFAYLSQVENHQALADQALDQAEKVAKLAAEKNPKDPEPHVRLGKIYHIKMLRNPVVWLTQAALSKSPVLTEYEKALDLDSDSWEAEMGLGQYWLFLPQVLGGTPNTARTHLKRAAKSNPENPEPLVWIATSYRMEDRLPKARVFLNQALALDPNNAFALAEDQRLKKAEQEVQKPR